VPSENEKCFCLLDKSLLFFEAHIFACHDEKDFRRFLTSDHEKS
jgi:hypothetical protein